MSNAITISGSTYTVTGTVRNVRSGRGVAGLTVTAYDKDLLTRDDYLGIAVTNHDGVFSISFDKSDFRELFFDRSPDLYFTVMDGGTVLADTKDNPIENANEKTPPITLAVNLGIDKARQEINKVPVPGWVGGFAQSNPDFAYPDPDLSSLKYQGNMDNIDKLQRQQKVLWPEFSWLTEPGETDPKRCYQMFAPDISRLGYTNEGRVYSIICPQQGACSETIGCMNVEVTVTGNRGWADESDRSLAADMSVEGVIWFSPSAHQNKLVQRMWKHFENSEYPFPFKKEHAIRINTFLPGNPGEKHFPLVKGETDRFPIPDFARHPQEAWSVGHLDVEIGGIQPSGSERVDKFNQMILNIFNMASGNMLKEGNVLSWNVWFTAPELVDQDEWMNHAKYWRTSIDAGHGSPEGEGSPARYFDGSPFKPVESLIEEEVKKIFEHLKSEF